MRESKSRALPLGYSPILVGAAGYDPATSRLSAECSTSWATLQYLVVQGRVELPTRGFSVHCSTSWATGPSLGGCLRVALSDLVSQTSIQSVGFTPTSLVGGVWFEHTKPKRLIYSQMVLAAYLPSHNGAPGQSRTGMPWGEAF